MLTHHDPIRTDFLLDEILETLSVRDDIPERLDVDIAREGFTIEL